MEYTMKAYPTEYRGRMYRSRLEAKWAAFFDQLGWAHEYEPVDLGSWSPDFLIRSTSSYGGELLIEVKPISEIDEDIIAKMASACKETGILDRENSDIRGALLVGLSPRPLVGERGPVQMGWLITDHSSKGSPVAITWTADFDEPKLNCDLIVTWDEGWFSVLEGDAAPGRPHHQGFRYYPDYVASSWARACNAVQWRKPR